MDEELATTTFGWCAAVAGLFMLLLSTMLAYLEPRDRRELKWIVFISLVLIMGGISLLTS